MKFWKSANFFTHPPPELGLVVRGFYFAKEDARMKREPFVMLPKKIFQYKRQPIPYVFGAEPHCRA